MIPYLLLFCWLPWWQAGAGPTAACAWHPAPTPAAQACFTLALAQGGQEIENQYIADGGIYARVLQYLNYGIARDVYLRLPGRPDSVAALAASYPRQYGSTGRSSVLLVFPVPEQQLKKGCCVSFRGDKFALGPQRFVFTAHDLKAARRGLGK